MNKEFDIEYLKGFYIEYLDAYNILRERFSINNNCIIGEYKGQTRNAWTISFEIILDSPKLYIKDYHLCYSGKKILLDSVLIEKLESYYTYNKRKKLLKELGI